MKASIRKAVRNRCVGWIALAVLTFVAAVRVTVAQDISDILPELKTLPAPASITEGLRLSYYSSVASVPPSFLTIWPDENGLVTPSASGHGFTQVDVVGLTPQLAGLSVSAWQFHLYTGPLVPIAGGTAALVCHAGGGDWWIHPQVLAKVQDASEPGLTILRMPRWIEILDTMGRLVTVLELLSPSNKLESTERDRYLRKRQTFIHGGANLVEIDLVRQGASLTPAAVRTVLRQAGAAYGVGVVRAAQPAAHEVYPIGLRDRLPAIRIPLRPEPVELAAGGDRDCGRVLPLVDVHGRLRIQVAKTSSIQIGGGLNDRVGY